MRVVTEFLLPKDEIEYRITVNASKYHSIVYGFDSWLRDLVKTGSGITKEHREAYENCLKALAEIAEDRGIVLYA